MQLSYDPQVAPPVAATWHLVSGPDGLSVNAATGAVRWTPAPRQVGGREVTLRLEAGAAGADEQTFTVQVDCQTNVALQTGCSCAAGPAGLGALAWALAALLRADRRRRGA